MAHPLHHAASSARRYGGRPEDYAPVHTWFDASKAHLALPQHRALRHHSAGIFEAERVFGAAIRNSNGREVPVRFLGEQHVREDCRRIPTVADWLSKIPLEPWMANGIILGPEDLPRGDARTAWVEAVSAGQTTLGLKDWTEDRERIARAARKEDTA
ncbi:DUF6915 family protein [Roseitranquillus sediminis]|uniref:DUF6915 family protein n=1 Tax=Roseitranquillus sediminis TaxID=2809051 RepID=UPI001D0C64EA|nr:hypothetical protein [Roseitranquillus sediminis]MBM9595096.1 hypothetical protein [Roseitranquillus sediminis]